MTIAATDVASASSSADVNWHMVEEGFWVANTRGMFLGTIEFQAPDRFFARNATRSYADEYSTFEAARAAVMAHVL